MLAKGGRPCRGGDNIYSRGLRNILIRPFSALLRAPSSSVVAADVLTKVPSRHPPSRASAQAPTPPPSLPPFLLLVPYFLLLSLSCRPKRYASSYGQSQETVSFSFSLLFSPSPSLPLHPSFALLRNNEGIYFINTGYPPRGIVLSVGEGK